MEVIKMLIDISSSVINLVAAIIALIVISKSRG